MPNSNEPSMTAATEAAIVCTKERLRQIELEDHLKIAFLEGVLWAKEREIERLQAISKEVTNAQS